MLCWVLGSLVLPTVSPLVPGVSAREAVVASGFGVGGGAGVGVAVSGHGFGRGWLGVAGCGRSPLLAEGLVGPLCPSGVSGGHAAPLAGGCWVLVLWVFVCCVRLWCGRCSRFGVWCAFVELVSVAAVAVCVVCMRGRVCSVLVERLGSCPRLFGLGFGGSVWVWGLCVVAPPPSRVWGLGVVPRPPWLGSVGGVSPRRPLCVPSPLCLFAASLGAVFPWCRGRACLAVVDWRGVLVVASGPFPWCFPFGGPMLALPVRV